MILVDANLLLYAHNEAAPDHTVARVWLEREFSQPTRVGLPWASLLGFVRLASNPAIFPSPLTPAGAWQYVVEWLTRDNVWVPGPGARHAEILGPLMSTPGMTARLVPDAHLAALALEHGLTLYSTDGDFARFPGLKWRNPFGAQKGRA